MKKTSGDVRVHIHDPYSRPTELSASCGGSKGSTNKELPEPTDWTSTSAPKVKAELFDDIAARERRGNSFTADNLTDDGGTKTTTAAKMRNR